MKFSNENIYSQVRGKMFSFLNKLLHEFRGLVPAIILIIFFCKLNILLLLDELPQKIIRYFIIQGVSEKVGAVLGVNSPAQK
jgi:hypothetical protein